MKEIITTEKAPKVIGPYSQAVRVGGLVFTAGQIGIDPLVGSLVLGGTKEEAKQALMNLSAVLEAAGSSFDQVIKTTIFLTNMGDYAAVNEAYSACFTVDYPARSAVAVKELPAGASVEIEMVALSE